MATLAPAAKKASKYGAKKTVADGITFDSKAEARHYQKLKLLERAGEITELTLQPQWLIAEAVTLDGRRRPARVYKADFCFKDREGRFVVQDCKGFKTDAYTLKRHIMKARYGIEVQEVRA